MNSQITFTIVILENCLLHENRDTDMEVLSDELTNRIWDMLYDEFKFKPSINNDGKEWISIPYENRVFKLNSIWIEEQESMINSFFEALVAGEMFALDWQHDCFSFSPKEHIPYEFEYYDDERNCNVVFPTYYPNGDYYMFFDKEWKNGLLGHPWRKEIIVIGKELISKFEDNKKVLDLR